MALMKGVEMNARQQVAANSQTQSDKHVPTAVPLTTKRKVTYILNTSASSSALKMPYVVAINGKVLADYKEKPKQVSGGKGSITLTVDPGDTVSLYLNSDAHPDYRKQAVYAITPKERDVIVTITEKTGKHADADTPTLKTKSDDAKKPDEYTAPLTGNIWLKISHKYTPAEAEKLIPAQTSPEIKAAVLKYYDGSLSSAKPENTVSKPAKDGQSAKTCRISISSEADNNAQKNIQSFNLYTDGLPRVHPHGYVALIEAAFDAGIEKLTLTSTWRPMVGSIAHRAGLGLDVNHLDSTRLNREELRKPKAVDTDNVSEEEKKRFKEKEAADAEAKKAKAERDKLQAEHKALLALKKTNPNKANPIREMALEKEIEEAEAKLEAANKNKTAAEKAWNAERDKNEPAKVKGYRASLLRCECVKQLYDPWYMEDDTQDKNAPTPNEQRPKPNRKKDTELSNEELHANHLHITVHEPKIR
jgi:hypothetical protein